MKTGELEGPAKRVEWQVHLKSCDCSCPAYGTGSCVLPPNSTDGHQDPFNYNGTYILLSDYPRSETHHT